MKTRYQMFISSTFVDLKDERGAIVKTILELGHIPVGMEMFSAADEEQWQIIRRHIDQSDYYIVVVAHRYGSLTEDGISFTEKEYDYAIQKKIPVLGFVINSKAPWPPDRMEKEDGKRKKLKRFKDKIKKKPVAFWSDKGELAISCLQALTKAIQMQPRPGWVRRSETPGPEVLDELARLSSENAELRLQVGQTNEKLMLEKLQSTVHTFNGLEKTYLDIFEAVASAVNRKSAVGVIYSAILRVFEAESSSGINAADFRQSADEILSNIRDFDLMRSNELSDFGRACLSQLKLSKNT